jgi:hypothetical protein
VASQSWVSLLNPASPQASGAGTAFTVGASTALLSPVTGAGATADVAVIQAAGQPLGWYPGLLVRVTARGYITTTTTTGTLTFLLRANKGNLVTAGSYVTLATTAAVTSYSGAAVTGTQWKMEALIRCVTVGTSGSVSTQGEMQFAPVGAMTILTTQTTPVVSTLAALPNASGETAATVDTTQVQGIDFACTGTAASGTVALTQWLVEALD